MTADTAGRGSASADRQQRAAALEAVHDDSHATRPVRLRRRRLSRLTLRILAINLFAVAILFVGVLYLDRYQNGLIRAELEALSRQAEIFGRAIAEIAVERDIANETGWPQDLVRRLLRHAAGTISTRARVFAPDGRLLADTLVLGRPGGLVQIRPLPPPREQTLTDLAEALYDRVINWLPRRGDMPRYREPIQQRAGNYEEVLQALHGEAANYVRVTDGGVLVLSVAVPVQRYKQVLGALLLSIEGGEIDRAVRAVRFEILGVFACVFAVTVLLSLYLASTITRPVQRLAAAAEAVRHARNRQHQIPDLSRRDDEIGDLSGALREMTESLWQRLDAIERFAADVAHEIKNPLTSVRSAVETVVRVTDPEQQRRLLAIVVEDVQRLDRLISDISESSRVDAELSREATAPVDLGAIARMLAELHEAAGPDDVRVACQVDGSGGLVVTGHESRLVQVLRNLISNAVSFSPKGGSVTLAVRRQGGDVVTTVEDEGPGIPEAKLAAIFDRFYSERPEGEKFGTHSGLGLSISKQIVEAHGGRIWAENRRSADGHGTGARFIVRLPAGSGP